MPHEVELPEAKMLGYSFDVMEAIEEVVKHSRRVVRTQSMALCFNSYFIILTVNELSDVTSQSKFQKPALLYFWQKKVAEPDSLQFFRYCT